MKGFKARVLKVKLKTRQKTGDDIINDFEGDVTENEIQEWLRAYKLIDGKEIIVAEVIEGRFTLVTWMDEDDEAFRDFIYQAEQDEMFGSYQDDREGFLQDWEEGEWESSGSLGFKKEDVEIIKELHKRENKNDVP